MNRLSWNDFYEKLNAISFEPFDLIAAIARGGITPAALIRERLQCDFMLISLSYRDDSHQPIYPDARCLENKPFSRKGLSILLVDDVIRSGKTMKAAKNYLNGNTIKTFAVNGAADYYIYNQSECFSFPWKSHTLL